MKKNKKKGLGDYVEQIAKPIAKVIDKTFGTDLEHCEGCEKRKKALNNLSASNKLPNNLSEAHTTLLMDYINKRYRNLDSKLQRRLQMIIEAHTDIRYKGTTSCSKCWRSTDKILKEIATKNGLYNK